MKLIDQRHRVLLHDALAQPLAVGAGQRCVQPLHHVGKAVGAAARLERLHLPRHPVGRMQAQGVGRLGQAGQGGEQRLQRGKAVGQVQGGGLFEGIEQPVGRQPVGGGGRHRGQVLAGRAGPGGQRVPPTGQMVGAQLGFVERAGLFGQPAVQPLPQRVDARWPTVLERGQRVGPMLLRALQGVAQRGPWRACLQALRPSRAVGVYTRPAAGHTVRQQGAHVGQQLVHPGPDSQHLAQRGIGQRVDLGAPEIVGSLRQQPGFVGTQLIVEPAAAVKRMRVQHALAPGVDGVDRCLVHRLGGHRQLPGRRLTRGAARVVGQQRLQHAVVGLGPLLSAKAACGLDQAGADAVRQLPGGGAGERHDQDLRRPQRAAVGGNPMAQHQAQVQRGDRPGLAGAGAGLDQPAAPQRQVQWVQIVGSSHSSIASPEGCATLTTRTPLSTQRSSGPSSASARGAKRPSATSAAKSG